MMKRIKILSLCLFTAAVVFSGCKKEDPYDAYKQLEADEQKIKAFMAANGITNATRDDSGVYYIISAAGTGTVTYQANTVITVGYTGRLLNGQVFDTSASYKQALGNLITGWQIGIPKIQPGGSIRLLIPSVYAYGPRPTGSIPANSILDFDIELKSTGP